MVKIYDAFGFPSFLASLFSFLGARMDAEKLARLGRVLAEARKSAGLSLRDVAAELGLSHQGVCRWELGQCSPPLVSLHAIARVYRVPLSRLLAAVE